MKTILVIEDFSGIRELVCRKLRSKGYSILTASTGKEAYDLLNKPVSEVNLVISDFDMPDVQEFDLLRMIKANPNLENLPIIYLDCKLFSDGKKEANKTGKIGFNVKAFHDDYFFREVGRAMKIAGSIVNIVN
jgi:CheY-like chemotaxis protein